MSASNVAVATPVGKGFQAYKPDRIFRFGQWVKIHYWTEEEDVVLRRDFRHTVKSLRELAVNFGVTENAVRQRLTSLGVLWQTVKWNKQELEYLEENYNKLSVRVIAEQLHKSRNSVTAKAHRMGITSRVKGKDGWFSMAEVAQIFGVDAGWIRRRLNNGLKMEREPYDPMRQPEKGSYAPWRVSEESLRDFIRKYPEELIGHNVDFVMLVDILAGVKT